MAEEQRTVYFSGDVQGVGFRYTACRTAAQYNVTGYARNLPDGRVECLVEGPDTEIDSFLADLARRMSGYIRLQEQQTARYSGRYKTFGVKF